MIEVCVDTKTLSQTKYNRFGAIYLSIDGRAFPEAGWNDLVIVLLGTWLVQADKLRSGASEREEFRFMDGPYRFAIEKVSGVHALIASVSGGTSSDRTELDLDEFRRKIVKAARNIIDECRSRHWASKDISILESLIARDSGARH